MDAYTELFYANSPGIQNFMSQIFSQKYNNVKMSTKFMGPCQYSCTPNSLAFWIF